MKGNIILILVGILFMGSQAYGVNSGAIANELLSADHLAKVAVVAGGGIGSHGGVFKPSEDWRFG
jgi:hypothetical protein